jgi:putative membrane protein
MNYGQLLSDICYGDGRTGDVPGLVLTLPLALFGLLYGLGALRLWRRSDRGHVLQLRRNSMFAAGWTVLAVALVSPLHPLSDRLFTAHMIEHELLMVVAPPLIVAAVPTAALMWSLPQSWRLGLARLGHTSPLLAVWAWITRPAVATVLHGVAIWAWHVPLLFEAALQRGVLHYVQHASFLGTGLLFWWALLPRPANRHAFGGSVMHLFFTSLHTGLLGVLLVMTPRLWYPQNGLDAARWGLSPIEDQQLAGLVMWVPAGLIYGGAALLVAGLWIRSSGRAVQEVAHA